MLSFFLDDLWILTMFRKRSWVQDERSLVDKGEILRGQRQDLG